MPRSFTRRGAAYLETGDGEPVLLLHGVGLRSEAWGPQITALSRAHRVIAVDLPGHGESRKIDRSARLPDFVGWLGDVLDDLGLRRASIAGHSMGALIAGGAAISFPERVTRVALLNAVFKRTPEARAAVVERARLLEAGQVDVLAPLSRWFDAAEAQSRPYQLVRACLLAVNPDGYATAYRAFAEGDDVYADRLSDLLAPALFLTSDGDANSTAEMSHAMAALAQNGQALVVPGHRHMVNLTAPDIVSGAMTAWLATGAR